jgi:hypothetical protein
MKKIIITLQILITMVQIGTAQTWLNPQTNGMLYYGSNENYLPYANNWLRPIWWQGGAQLNEYNTGNPIFTTNGATAWNAVTGAVMPNGTGLLGGNFDATPATIAAMDTASGYLITTENITASPNALYYSRYLTGIVGSTYSPSIDASAKNIQLFAGNHKRFLEKTTIVRRPNFNGEFWLIVHAINPLAPAFMFTPKSNTISVFRGTSTGISFFANYNLGTMVGVDHGQMKSSVVDAFGTCFIAAAYYNERKIDVYKFDANSGNMVLHGVKNMIPFGVFPYGIEFSNTGNYIYFTNLGANNSLGRLNYLGLGMPVNMAPVAIPAIPKRGRLGEMQLMRNNQIYFPIVGRQFILELSNPILPGTIFGWTSAAALNTPLVVNATYSIPNFNRE